jgi:hypothetical protein
MPKTSRVIQTLAILLAVTTFASGCKTLETKASESYEYWRIRTGDTSVAAFYTENGLQETCHGFWAKDYRETDPDSPCFSGTTKSGIDESQKQEIVTVDPIEIKTPEVVITQEPEVTPVEPTVTPEPTVVKEDPAPVPPKSDPEPQPTPEKKDDVVVEQPEKTNLPKTITPEKPWVPSPLTLWVVHPGEHLWGISAHHLVYGDPYQWPLLFKRNRHQIEDADLIYPGQVLHIERSLSTAEIDRAIEHAKTRGAWILGITELSDLEYLSRERSHQ